MLLLEATLPTEPFKFFACPIMAYFRKSLHESNTISAKQALHVVKIQFWTLTPNSCALASAGSVMTTGLSINGCSHSKKPVWRDRTRLTSPEVWAASTSKVWSYSGRASFNPPHSSRQNKALLTGWKSYWRFKTQQKINKVTYQPKLQYYCIFNIDPRVVHLRYF